MEGYFGRRRGVGLKDSILFPLCLIFLLDCYEGVSFFGLQSGRISVGGGTELHEGYLRLSILYFQQILLLLSKHSWFLQLPP